MPKRCGSVDALETDAAAPTVDRRREPSIPCEGDRREYVGKRRGPAAPGGVVRHGLRRGRPGLDLRTTGSRGRHAGPLAAGTGRHGKGGRSLTGAAGAAPRRHARGPQTPDAQAGDRRRTDRPPCLGRHGDGAAARSRPGEQQHAPGAPGRSPHTGFDRRRRRGDDGPRRAPREAGRGPRAAGTAQPGRHCFRDAGAGPTGDHEAGRPGRPSTPAELGIGGGRTGR